MARVRCEPAGRTCTGLGHPTEGWDSLLQRALRTRGPRPCRDGRPDLYVIRRIRRRPRAGDAGAVSFPHGRWTMPTSFARLAALTLLGLACGTRTAAQQDSTTSPDAPRPWQLGGTVMVPNGLDSFDVTFSAIGLTGTSARPNRICPDVAVVIVPQALQVAALLGGVRANLGTPLTIAPTVTLVPSAGLTLLGAVGGGGGGGTYGSNRTLAMLVFSALKPGTTSLTGLRLEISQHRLRR